MNTKQHKQWNRVPFEVNPITNLCDICKVKEDCEKYGKGCLFV